MSIVNTVKNEPLIVFVLVAAIFFMADYGLNHNKKNVIEITPAIRMAILNQEEALKGEALTPEEEIAAVNTYIDNKVFIAEAIRLGLDNDRSIHTVLLKKFRVLSTAEVPEPSALDLEGYYNDHKTDYVSPTTFDVEQVFFGVGVPLPEHFSAQLRNLEKSDVFLNSLQLSSIILPKMSEREIIARMGKNVANAVVSEKIETWFGPLSNERGTYFIRILARYDGEIQPLMDVSSYVRDAWITNSQNSILQKKLAQLKEGYKITIANSEMK